MAHERDYEDIHDIDELDDRELRDLVRGHLARHTALDIDDITVTAKDGCVPLNGRVGTEGEKRVAEHVLTDVLGITEFENDLVIDGLYATGNTTATVMGRTYLGAGGSIASTMVFGYVAARHAAGQRIAGEKSR